MKTVLKLALLGVVAAIAIPFLMSDDAPVKQVKTTNTKKAVKAEPIDYEKIKHDLILDYKGKIEGFHEFNSSSVWVKVPKQTDNLKYLELADNIFSYCKLGHNFKPTVRVFVGRTQMSVKRSGKEPYFEVKEY